jgi:hypothetical protein
MSEDLSRILDGWQYVPDEILVRIVEGDDGRQKIQMRIDLGVLQMEMDGRPDGTRPEGCESWLDHYEQKQRKHDRSHPDTAAFQLEDEDCARLWHEGVQYYHRYLSFWHLGLYDLCARDTRRNLRLFAFVRSHANDERHAMQFDQWRPYVTMMHARSAATPLIEKQDYAAGLKAIEEGIDAIRDFLDEYSQSHRAEECAELGSLERWRDEILAREARAREAQPKSAAEVLRQQLETAIADEAFEKAARLRDEIRRLQRHAKKDP